MFKMTRRAAIVSLAALSLTAGAATPAFAQDKLTFTLATSGSETDQRSVAMANVFAPMVAEFADYRPGYNGTLFAQGTELEAISRGNLTMSIASAQEMAQFFPEFSIFATGYVHQDAAHQVRVFNDPLMDAFKAKAEEELGVKLLAENRLADFGQLLFDSHETSRTAFENSCDELDIVRMGEYAQGRFSFTHVLSFLRS